MFVCMHAVYRIMWWAWPFLPAMVLLSELSVVRVQTAPCQTCKKLTESFIKVVLVSKETVNACLSSLSKPLKKRFFGP